jgi:predicted alpha-1,2-mannosidase
VRYFFGCWSLFLLFGCNSSSGSEQDIGLAAFVDPFIGTGGHGHTYPGATVPFGSVQLSPDNGKSGWDWCSGYHYSDSIIVGFSHTHLSGTGIGDLCDVLVMPYLGEENLTQTLPDFRSEPYASTFNHERERAYPGYYSVHLDNGILAELSATTRVGFHKYTFPEGGKKKFVIDLSYAVNWDRPVETFLRKENDQYFSGYRYSTGWAADQRVHFAIVFSEQVKSFELYDSTVLQLHDEVRGRKVRAVFTFSNQNPVLLVKVGISSASEEGAARSLNEIPHWNFDQTKVEAVRLWNRELGKVHVPSGDETLKRIFYSALYHSFLAPVVYEDALGQYKAPDQTVRTAEVYTRYDIFSLWDTFRAGHPLYTILQPSRINDFIHSLMAHYEEYGLLPVWSLLGNETNTMTGYHAIPVIADAYLKGYREHDSMALFEAMKASSMQDIRGTDYYRDFGYIPYDLDGQSVTRTLEYAYDDWCIAQVARVLGRIEDATYYESRSESYKNIFDPETRFMRAKNSNDGWKSPFDPYFSNHGYDSEYTEGNAWQHAWFVPHDIRGLIDLHGGNEAFISRLDTLFSDESLITGMNVSADISGLIGQYAHGNEPSHHIAYLYNYAGAPWKTQEKVREIIQSQYSDSPDGLSGNEDCGQMSAWFVFSAMGFYPVNPAEGIYSLGSPAFPETEIYLENDLIFEIKARYHTPENIYIQSAMLNGEPLTRSYIMHHEIMEGGVLELEMGPLPNLLHWSDRYAWPPSMSEPMDTMPNFQTIYEE